MKAGTQSIVYLNCLKPNNLNQIVKIQMQCGDVTLENALGSPNFGDVHVDIRYVGAVVEDTFCSPNTSDSRETNIFSNHKSQH